MSKISDIDILSEATSLKKTWSARNVRMLQDRDIVNLVKPQQDTSNEPDRVRWMSNEPKVFFETCKALISSYPPRFRMPLTMNYDADEKQKIAKAERFVLGIFRQLDKSLVDMGSPNAYWLRGLAHWILSGWYSVFTYIRKEGKDVRFIADLWDPISVYPKWDSFGLQKCVRSYEVDKDEADAMAQGWSDAGLKFDYQEPSGQSKVEINNYWLRTRNKKKGSWTNEVFNAITIGGKQNLTIVKNLEKEDFKHIPIFIGAIGSPERTSGDWPQRHGEHIISDNRDLYDYTNQLISLMAVIMAETAFPNVISKTKTGQRVTKGGMKGYGSEYALKVGETVDLLKHAASPAEVATLLQYIGQQKQKGALPDIVYGGVPVELSGFAISQLMAAIRYKIAPYLVTMDKLIGIIATEFLEQYRDGKYPAITLDTQNPRELKKGMFFVEEFSSDDVPEVTFVEAKTPITSAMDKTQQIIFARQALDSPQLMSRETLWDEVLDIQDSEQEYARILQDQMLEDEFVKSIGIIEQMRKRETLYRENGRTVEADALHRYILMLEMKLGMRQGVPETAGSGIPPNVMPPEAMNSPDMARSALGITPPGLNRRPQTAQERAESEGGKLVGPTGERLL